MKEERKVKIVAISDTHGANDKIKKVINQKIQGDIFIHAGDFTWYNKREHFNEFVNLIGQLNFKHKIVIPGNHQILLDPSFGDEDRKALGYFHVHPQMTIQKQLQKLKTCCTYLDHDYIQIEGIRIFASSYTLIPPYYRTAFQMNEQEMEKVWQGVPTDIHILLTHSPPFSVLDKTVYEGQTQNVGSKTIYNYLKKTKAKVHIFGHIHQAKGRTQVDGIGCYNVAQLLQQIQISI